MGLDDIPDQEVECRGVVTVRFPVPDHDTLWGWGNLGTAKEMLKTTRSLGKEAKMTRWPGLLACGTTKHLTGVTSLHCHG